MKLYYKLFLIFAVFIAALVLLIVGWLLFDSGYGVSEQARQGLL